MYSVGLNAPLKCGRRCFFHTLAKANAKANAPLKPERRAKSQNECPPNAPLNAPLAGSLLYIRFGASFRSSATWQPFRHAKAQCQVYNGQLV